MDEKFCSLNYLDLQLGKEYIEQKFTESIYHMMFGRELNTGHFLRPISPKKVRCLGKINFKLTCKLVLRHRDIIRRYELEHQKKNEKPKIQYKTNMESFL